MSEPTRSKQDLVLAPGEYAYLQDTTKGAVRVYTGPTVATPSAQDVPVIYDEKTNSFKSANSLAEAICHEPLAKEGSYLALTNPAKNGSHPDENSRTSPELDTGRRINIEGPIIFALWPTQSAQVIEGHKLRSNQYLLLEVYNEDEARKNWQSTVQKNIDGSQVKVGEAPKDLTTGKLLIIKGTEVSFYIPPTGIRVLPEANGSYIRDALTLERLEYCILKDESGRKRYERGPQVVFPAPTEQWIEKKDKDGMVRKFRAIELNPIQGLHLKCIAPFVDEQGVSHQAGEEMFITGKDTAIYFPREEIAEVRYDGKSKHFASAVPKGEARYVLDRLTGKITKVEGPAMLQPDPRTQVFVRRVLNLRECELMYPGNDEVAQYNAALLELANRAPTTRAGAISEGDVERGSRAMLRERKTGGVIPQAMNYMLSANSAKEMSLIGDTSEVSRDANLMSGDEFSRASTYTDPRTVTLSTKYQGAPLINVWPGYAVQVVSKDGARRVEVGPKAILLEYDETLEALSLSTGKPKTSDKLLHTAYMRVENNGVSDIITAETSDHVQVQMKLSYRVNFEGDSNKWFVTENYVKFLCDHCRSVLKNAVRQIPIVQFHASAEQIIRDTILGKNLDGKRAGMVFSENGMRVYDVEILDVTLGNENIKKLLDGYQHAVVRGSIELQEATRELEAHNKLELIKQDRLKAEAHTKQVANALQQILITSEVEVFLKKSEAQRTQEIENRKVTELQQAMHDFVAQAEVNRRRIDAEAADEIEQSQNSRKIELQKAEAEAFVTRITAGMPFAQAVTLLGDEMLAAEVAKAMSVQHMLGGKDAVDVLIKVFEGTPLKAWMEQKFSNFLAPSNGGSKPELHK